ncbi:DUF2690 domain-containing protein [Streptomyces sp. NPDC048057]|uniref:helix-turn-helix domain-containing protein n=1 Tax=Streptomyces sp. NPDC048057 TaxID=3155628 RepID=UPI0033F1E8A1
MSDALEDAAGQRAEECERLASELRALRTRTGLSLVALAARTPYSKSSWQRYLNGTKPLPRQAVVALCTLAGEPPARLLALWELADAAWSGRAAADAEVRGVRDDDPADSPADNPAGGPDEAPRGKRRTVLLAASAGLTVATAATALGAWWLSGDEAKRGSDGAAKDDPTWSIVAPLRPSCTGPQCAGEDPALMGCGADGVMTTLGSFTASGGQRLQLRYGETCRTVWARATGLRVGDRVVLSVPGQQDQHVTAVARRDADRYLVTPMSSAVDPSEARVCLVPEGGGGQECLGRERGAAGTAGS